ncbi:Transport permease protein [Azospirillaceae bacterium]
MRYQDEDGTLITLYQRNERVGGLVWGVRQAVEDIFISRHVIVRLFWRDFVEQFRQKMLGYFWALLNPLFGITSFIFFFFVGVLKPGEGEIPFVIYALVGSTIWGCLPGAMGVVSGGLQAQSDLVMRTRIPKLALAVSSLSGLFYGIFVSMGTMTIFFLIVGVTPSIWFFAYPVLVLPMVLLGTAMGLVLSVLGPIARDIIPITGHALSFVMYITPVIYTPSTIQNRFIKALIEWNPITYLVDVPRSLICLGHTVNSNAYLFVAVTTIFFIVVGLRVFYLLEDMVAERL